MLVLTCCLFSGMALSQQQFYNTSQPNGYFPGKFNSAAELCKAYKSLIQSSEDSVAPGGVASITHNPRANLTPTEKDSDWCSVNWTRTVHGEVSSFNYDLIVYSGGCYAGRTKKPNSGHFFYSEPDDCNGFEDHFLPNEPCLPCLTNGSSPQSNPRVGNPIYPLTGSRRQDVDLGLSVGGQPIKITYDTAAQVPEASGGLTWLVAPPPSFGPRWQSNMHKSLVLQSENGLGAAYSSVVMQRGAGTFLSAGVDGSDSCSGSGGGSSPTAPIYKSTVNRNATLQYTSAGAGTLVDGFALSEESYDTTGAVTTIAQAIGGSLTYGYTTGLLTSITDQFGRTVHFAYEQPADTNLPQRINLITAVDDSLIHVGYDASNNLNTLTWADNNVRTFVYENANFPWALTGIIDESNARYSTYGYDAQGRANDTFLGAGANRYSVTYGQAPFWSITQVQATSNFICREHRWQPPVGTQVTMPSAQVSNFSVTAINGMVALTGQDQPSGSGSTPSALSQSYDASGNMASYDDFNGNRACFAYDPTRNLPTLTLEGLAGGTSGKACPANLAGYSPSASDAMHPERKTTTVWHPDWVLKTREAAPKKITTWVYNGQPDPIAGTTASCVTPATTLPDGKPLAVLCARYEQATTDTTGALGLSATVTGATRAWTYTYNQYGQVMTETTPKQSPTDVLSHTTTYAYYPTTSFTGSVGHTKGDLNTITNPLLQVTTFTSYDKAGRLLSSQDANATVTSMTYWPRGWLHTQTVTPASGSPLTTTYDYWPTGLLKTVTMPDASTLNYAYDDAHRLTDVTDAAGNKIHYVLDNVGNRTSEQVSDASGRLASSVTRVYDQLNRVQSTTGAMR